MLLHCAGTVTLPCPLFELSPFIYMFGPECNLNSYERNWFKHKHTERGHEMCSSPEAM